MRGHHPAVQIRQRGLVDTGQRDTEADERGSPVVVRTKVACEGALALAHVPDAAQGLRADRVTALHDGVLEVAAA